MAQAASVVWATCMKHAPSSGEAVPVLHQAASVFGNDTVSMYVRMQPAVYMACIHVSCVALCALCAPALLGRHGLCCMHLPYLRVESVYGTTSSWNEARAEAVHAKPCKHCRQDWSPEHICLPVLVSLQHTRICVDERCMGPMCLQGRGHQQYTF